MKVLRGLPAMLAGAVMACATGDLRAQEPTPPAPETSPSTQAAQTDSTPRDESMRPYGRSFMGGWGPGPAVDVSDEDWQAASTFMREHSPNRWAVFERLSEASPRRGPVMRMILARYRNLANVKEEDSELYELRVQQLALEDAIWGLLREMRSNQTSEERRTEIQAELREKVAQSVDTWIKERQRRLARLEETLKQERARLEADLKRIDTMVENRLQRELERASDYMGFPRGRGQRGEERP